MSVGVETDRRPRERRMAFRSIGELAGTVLQNAKTAAHADKLRTNWNGGPTPEGVNTDPPMLPCMGAWELDGGPTLPGGATIDPPVTLNSRGEPERNVNEVADRAATLGPLVLGSTIIKEPSPARRGPVLVHSTKCESTLPPPKRVPARGVDSHLRLVAHG